LIGGERFLFDVLPLVQGLRYYSRSQGWYSNPSSWLFSYAIFLNFEGFTWAYRLSLCKLQCVRQFVVLSIVDSQSTLLFCWSRNF
jgi:hypothetical protein